MKETETNNEDIPKPGDSIYAKLSFIQKHFYLEKNAEGNRKAEYWDISGIKGHFRSIISEHNLDVSCRLEYKFLSFEGVATMDCIAILVDSKGEKISTSFPCYIDAQAGMNPPMKCGSTGSYGGRYALAALFNLTDEDTKKNDPGPPIDPESKDYPDSKEVREAYVKSNLMTEKQKNALLSKFENGYLNLSEDERSKIENCKYTTKEVQKFFDRMKNGR